MPRSVWHVISGMHHPPPNGCVYCVLARSYLPLIVPPIEHTKHTTGCPILDGTGHPEYRTAASIRPCTVNLASLASSEVWAYDGQGHRRPDGSGTHVPTWDDYSCGLIQSHSVQLAAAGCHLSVCVTI